MVFKLFFNSVKAQPKNTRSKWKGGNPEVLINTTFQQKGNWLSEMEKKHFCKKNFSLDGQTMRVK